MSEREKITWEGKAKIYRQKTALVVEGKSCKPDVLFQVGDLFIPSDWVGKKVRITVELVP